MATENRQWARCMCGEKIRLPLNDWPVLCDAGEVYLPKLVAVRCPSCRREVRLDGETTNDK